MQQMLLMASGCGGPLRRMTVAQTCININPCGRHMDRIAVCTHQAKCMLLGVSAESNACIEHRCKDMG